ncbi:MAG TPA: alpha/beta hydrolase domain-containing protein, partial [Terriglobales bacterium]|nr:alpha/beta hydrolase domain-containing protein [Terriglobales bacterium]
MRSFGGGSRRVGWLLAMVVALGGCGGDDGQVKLPPPPRGEAVARAIVEGPVGGGAGMPFVASTTFDLGEVGYLQEEYFIVGTAVSYRNLGPLATDGIWLAEPAGSAEYRTRIVVYRPRKRGDFKGTVFLEWLNVSGGLDAAADWLMTHTELIRSGHAWVGVSAQKIGVDGGTPLLPGLPVMPLKVADPERYASLIHPGDSFSYDIFSQAAQAIRRPSGPAPLGELEIQAVIATGDSQSAFRLVTYINAVHPLANIFDGFLVHSRGSLLSAPLSEPPQAAISTPGTAAIREDVDA